MQIFKNHLIITNRELRSAKKNNIDRKNDDKDWN